MQDDRARIEQAIREAASDVDRMRPTPGARELKTRLETFRRELASWGTSAPPTPDQVAALAKQVDEVRVLARGTAPTVKARSRPGGD